MVATITALTGPHIATPPSFMLYVWLWPSHMHIASLRSSQVALFSNGGSYIPLWSTCEAYMRCLRPPQNINWPTHTILCISYHPSFEFYLPWRWPLSKPLTSTLTHTNTLSSTLLREREQERERERERARDRESASLYASLNGPLSTPLSP